MTFLGVCIGLAWVVVIARSSFLPRTRFDPYETDFLLALLFLTGWYILLVSACFLAQLFSYPLPIGAS